MGHWTWILTQLFVLQVAALLPINALRDAALLMADTPLVLPMDMDMLINRELNALAGDPKRRAHVAPNHKDTRLDRTSRDTQYSGG